MDISDFEVKFGFDSQFCDMVWLYVVLKIPDFLCDEDNISGFNTTMESVIHSCKA